MAQGPPQTTSVNPDSLILKQAAHSFAQIVREVLQELAARSNHSDANQRNYTKDEQL